MVDTGIFDDGRYWVVTVDYAKAGARDLLMQITVENAGPEAATIDVLPTLWFRNTWSWGYPEHEKPNLRWANNRIVGAHSRSGPMMLVGDGSPEALFCENETNDEKLFGSKGITPYPKDGINDHVVSGADTVNPAQVGTKAALRYSVTVPAGQSRVIKLRMVGSPHPAVDGDPTELTGEPIDLGAEFDAVVRTRKEEADEFYASVIPEHRTRAEAQVARQAFAGLLWGKQFFHYDVKRWLDGDPGQPAPPPGRGAIRNGEWRHLSNHDVILMPDPWEYPWFAAWDLAFHCVTLAHIDPAFAKGQLILLLREWYMHPNGQIPAYEWNFSDVNPPVHGWAAMKVFELDGGTDFHFLARIFHKLLINFTWWVDNKDFGGNNLFEGGFMGLDNIAPLDRSTFPPSEGYVEQADSTAWMGMYALDMLDMALRLATNDNAYEDVAIKFFEHFLAIAGALNNAGLWNDEDAYFYDMLHLKDGTDVPIKVKSLVGLVPITAALTYGHFVVDSLPEFRARAEWFLLNNPEFMASFHVQDIDGERHRLLAMVSPERLIRVLNNVFDESGLLSEFGIRAISAWHRDHPFSVEVGGTIASVDYEPAESTTALFGGNSNWRGPIWMPLNALLVEALRSYDELSPGQVTVEYPVGSGKRLSLGQAADDISGRLVSIFLPGANGRRPVHGGYDLLATDPRWKDNIPFHEYFHGDTGAGLGAEHQTGWTALVAHLLLTGAPPASRNTVPAPDVEAARPRASLVQNVL